MSEVGNILRALRASKAHAIVSKETGFSIKPIQRAESGDLISLQSLRVFATYYKLKPADRAAIIIAWLRDSLGDDFQLLAVNSPFGRAKPTTDAQRFLNAFTNVPAKYQRELLDAIKHEEILRA